MLLKSWNNENIFTTTTTTNNNNDDNNDNNSKEKLKNRNGKKNKCMDIPSNKQEKSHMRRAGND